MSAEFFKGQEGYDARARDVLNDAAVDAANRPWVPFYFVAVALWDGSVLVLAVQGIGLS